MIANIFLISSPQKGIFTRKDFYKDYPIYKHYEKLSYGQNILKISNICNSSNCRFYYIIWRKQILSYSKYIAFYSLK